MDHGIKVPRKRNPRETANVLSLLTFWYSLGLFKISSKSHLNVNDLPEILDCCESKKCGDKLEKIWNDNVESSSIFHVILKRFGKLYAILGVLTLIIGIIRSFLEPYATSNFVTSFNENGVDLKSALYYGTLVIGVNLLNTFWFFNVVMVEHRLCAEVRTSLSTLIYRKALKLNTFTSASTLGRIVTLITKDIVIIESAMWFFSDSCIAVLKTLITCYLLYNEMGIVGFVGVALIVGILPIQMLIGRNIGKLRLNIGKKTDDRLQITQATLTAIKIIKMFTWEKYFFDKISAARKKEMRTLLSVLYQKVLVLVIGALSSRIGFYVVIMVYIWTGHTTTTKLIIYVLTLFQSLRHTLGVTIPFGFFCGGEMYAALYRIGLFLKSEELPTHQMSLKGEPKIQLTNIQMQINEQTVLKIPSFTALKGLTVITGHVGSGKSSLIKLILKDYLPKSGNVFVNGRISYASQDPWLFPSSIRQNILFGETYDPDRYSEVIRICTLDYDLGLFENGDETIVADRGLNLSRGQQARINLARAIYKNADIYLIDDSLTALDNRVQDYVFVECIGKFLSKKICILVTQNVHHIEKADQVAILENGTIVFSGKPKDTKFKNITENFYEKRQISNGFCEHEEHENNDEKENLLKKKNHGEDTKDVYSETRKEGYVNWDVYKKYFQFGGGIFIFFLIIVLFVVVQFMENYSDKLLAKWIDLQQKVLDFTTQNITNSTYFETKAENKYTLNLYTTVTIIGSALLLVKSFVLYNFCRKVSINIHKRMLSQIVYAVMIFFDTNYIGNIINRFSLDLHNIDEYLPNLFAEVIRVFLALIGSTYLVASVNAFFLIPIGIISIILLQLRQYYVRAGRNLQRLQLSIRSPLVGYINSSLEGLTTIRAFQAEQILKNEFDTYQNLFTSVLYSTWTLKLAFGFFADLFINIMVTVVILAVLYLNPDVSAGNAGLVLTQMIALATTLHWGLTETTGLELQMTSMERAIEYTAIETEDNAGIVVPKWPKTGKIVYQNVTLTYGAEKVLKNITFTIEPNEKIGIVGRTGAGKSTIISTLFKLYKFNGSIYIDNIDTHLLSRKFLRSNIAIIPQDPFLFRETIRANLDPLNEYDDKQLWQVLKQVHLQSIIDHLEFQVLENGSNFSAGQKQLLCLARAILRKNQIVILDEATANLDPDNEILLQSVIKAHFTNCTVITVAHRLTSIMDCDRVMVLNGGEIVEFDSPIRLLRDRVSLFKQMVDKSN